MSLIKSSSNATDGYQVELTSSPSIIRPGENVQFRFVIFNSRTHEQVKDLNVVHDKPFHLFVVSQDLSYFQHIHPMQTSDGSFIVKTVLPKIAQYKIFCDFYPVGGTPQLIRKELITTGFTRNVYKQVRISTDQTLTKSVDGIRFNLTINPAELVEGKLAHLNYYLLDEKLGVPVRDLQPYLGAWGHTFILSEDMADYVHVHPEVPISPDVDRSTLVSEPYVSFETFFPKAGRYRIWSQFQRHDRVITVSFTLQVSHVDKVARWDGVSWSALPGTSTIELKRTVHAIAINRNNVYVGGDFNSIGGISANRIAHWDGSKWQALGSGLDDGIVYAIAVRGSDIFVGGTFTTAGGVRVNRMAKWDGRAWSALGHGVAGCTNPYCSPTIYAIAVDAGSVYVGGQFSGAGDVSARAIARWNGTSWASLGSGIRSGSRDGIVMSLAVNEGNVYAGGMFTNAGQSSANNIARWVGNAWSALGDGIRGDRETVRSIAISGNNLYAVGAFSTAGGATAHNVAKWNGSTWSSLEVEAEKEVWAIAVRGTNIYLSGNSFRIPTGATVKGLVRWNSKGWSGLGDGIPLRPITAIGVTAGDVYVVGG
jgi:hypothetical protein